MAVRPRILRRRTRPDGAADGMTLGQHLAELRNRLVVSVLAFTTATIVAFVFYQPILRFLQSPYCHIRPGNCQLYLTSPLGGLSLRIEIAGYGGLFLASPIILFELWRFITPGLHANEKRYVIPFVTSSMVLFSAGAVLAYLTFPHALGFLQSVGGPSLREIYDPGKYIGLILALMAVFGITFEFPVVLVSLQVVGVLKPAKLASWRRWAIVAITIVAAVITPSGDPFSMLALAVPLYIFYEVSIVIGRLLKRSS